MKKLIVFIGTIIFCIFIISYTNNSRIVRATNISGTTVYRIGAFKGGEIQTFNCGSYHFVQAVYYDKEGVAVKQCNSSASSVTVYRIGSYKGGEIYTFRTGGTDFILSVYNNGGIALEIAK